MNTKYKGTPALIVVALLVAALSLLGVPFDAAAQPQFEVVASGLDNPRGLAFGPEGALYVAEAGEGGDVQCGIPGPFGELCYGPTAGVTRILNGEQERVISGLSSFASPEGRQAFGAHDISFQGLGGAYVPVGVCFLPTADCGRVLKVSAGDQWRVAGEILAWELQNDPDGAHYGESNPYAVLAMPGEQIVADAAGNTLLRVDANGQVSMLALFPARDAGGFPMDAVPTAIAMGPDGAYYVGELTGFPFPVGGARIYRVVPGQAPEVYADGFTNIIDLAFDNDGSLLVLEMAKSSLLSADPAGQLIRLNPDLSRETLIGEGLVYPSAVAIGDDGAIYVSNNGQDADIGEVLRFELD